MPVFDAVVAGAGVVGLSLAIALARDGFTVASLGPLPGALAGRTVALLQGSVSLLRAIGVWPALAFQAAPLRTMRIVDDTPALLRAPPVTFEAAAIGLAAFGSNVANDALVAALAARAAATPGLRRIESLAEGHMVGDGLAIVHLADGTAVGARIVVAADGARSVLRASAGIAVRTTVYPQVALTAALAHTHPHGDTSTEFHTRQGPFTLVPLPDGTDGRHRSSLVWVMTATEAERRGSLAPAALARSIEAQSRGLLGTISVEGPVGRFPIRRQMAERLTASRLALVGEAAHAMPPIGAQGLNLSMRDIATLVDEMVAARRGGADIGGRAMLDRYERSRIGDITLRGFGVHALNESLLSASVPVDILRGVGLRAVAAFRPLREILMRQGLSPSGVLPRLMRDLPADT